MMLSHPYQQQVAEIRRRRHSQQLRDRVQRGVLCARLSPNLRPFRVRAQLGYHGEDIAR